VKWERNTDVPKISLRILAGRPDNQVSEGVRIVPSKKNTCLRKYEKQRDWEDGSRDNPLGACLVLFTQVTEGAT